MTADETAGLATVIGLMGVCFMVLAMAIWNFGYMSIGNFVFTFGCLVILADVGALFIGSILS